MVDILTDFALADGAWTMEDSLPPGVMDDQLRCR